MPLFADTDWSLVIGAVGSAIVLVVGALGREWYKVAVARWAAEDKAKRDTKNDQRKDRKEAIDEYREVVEIMRKDRESDRELIHDMRTEMGRLKNRLSICEWDREQLHEELAAHRFALEKAGITIPPRTTRPRPVPEVLPEEGGDDE